MLDDAVFLPFNAIVYRSNADYSRLLTFILRSNASHVGEKSCNSLRLKSRPLDSCRG